MDFSGIKAISDLHGSVKQIESNGRVIWRKNADNRIFGVEWGRTESPVWTRTDDAVGFSAPVPYVAGMTAAQCSSPFDGIMPWAGMTRVTDAEAGELVAIPKFYYKWSNDSSKMKLQISPSPQVGFLTSPAHLARNENETERDVVYVGRYHCATSTYKSTSGVLPQVSKSLANDFRYHTHRLGSNIWQWDHAMLWTICMLYLVEFANANSQAMIGYGCSPDGSVFNMGYTDSMPYHTGTDAASRTTYGGTQYRNIEGLWDNVRNFCDGIYFSSANVYHILDPSKFSSSKGGVLTGIRDSSISAKVATDFAFPSTSGYEWAGYVSTATSDSTYSKYFCDEVYGGSDNGVLVVGGSSSQNLGSGLFSRNSFYIASASYSTIGSRLMKLP